MPRKPRDIRRFSGFPRYLLVLSLGWLASISHAAPILSEVVSTSSAQLTSSGIVVDDEISEADSQATTLDRLSAFTSLTITDGSTTSTVSSGIAAIWQGPNAGTVALSNFFETVGTSNGLVTGNVTSGGRFTYIFEADFDGTLSVFYDTLATLTPDALGAGGYSISVSGLGNAGTGSGTSSSGVATFDLVGGTAYGFQIAANTNLGGNLGERRLNSTGVFDWVFAPANPPPTPLPEPGSLGLLGLGLLLARLGRRRLR